MRLSQCDSIIMFRQNRLESIIFYFRSKMYAHPFFLSNSNAQSHSRQIKRRLYLVIDGISHQILWYFASLHNSGYNGIYTNSQIRINLKKIERMTQNCLWHNLRANRTFWFHNESPSIQWFFLHFPLIIKADRVNQNHRNLFPIKNMIFRKTPNTRRVIPSPNKELFSRKSKYWTQPPQERKYITYPR